MAIGVVDETIQDEHVTAYVEGGLAETRGVGKGAGKVGDAGRLEEGDV